MPPGPGDIEKGCIHRVERAKDKIMKSKTFTQGYTSLHEAVRSRHVDVVKILIDEDPEYSGPNGKTALHGAVIFNNKRCAELLLNWKTNLAEEKDSNDQTPLHFVAHLGYAYLVSSLLLLDKSVAYLKDNMKNKAIHIAASRDHVSVLKEIMSRCPGSWDMTSYRCQNILHMGMKRQQKNVIEYILEECPITDAMINQKDVRESNTPLHLLCISNYSLPQFILHPMADRGVTNSGKMTALDLVTNNVKISTTTKLWFSKGSPVVVVVVQRRCDGVSELRKTDGDLIMVAVASENRGTLVLEQDAQLTVLTGIGSCIQLISEVALPVQTLG
ncbi:hypothetical protein LguiA_031044 [Lonicera macranthoides]